jgi:integrase
MTTTDLVLADYAVDPATLVSALSPEAFLAMLNERATEQAPTYAPANTRAAYAEAWQRWLDFLASLPQDIDPDTAEKGLFLAFVQWLACTTHPGRYATSAPRTPNAPSTCRHRLYGVIVTMRQHGVPIPSDGGPQDAALLWINAFERELRKANEQRGRGQAVAVTLDQLCVISRNRDRRLDGLRDVAMMLLGFSIASRRSEVASLLGTDIVEVDGGLEVTVRMTKGDKTRIVYVAMWEDPAVCPVRAWRAWRDAAGITTGPAFCHIRNVPGGGGQRHAVLDAALSVTTVGRIVKKLGRLAGADLDLTGHSLRAGLVTAALDGEMPLHMIAEIGGWSLQGGTMYKYKRTVDRKHNTANRLR